jgi:hypothetical protein
MPLSPRQQDRPFEHFGRLLRSYRESYGERIHRKYPDVLETRLTASTLISCMHRSHQYDIASGAYSEVEAGLILPREPQAFLDAVTACLAIDEGSDEYVALARALAHDVVSWRAGKAIANRAIPLPESSSDQ